MPRPMKVTNEPALGIDRENSDIVFPVARIATPAIRNAHGAIEPMAKTTSVIARKMPSTGARLASVEEIVSNRVSAPRASSVWAGPAFSSIVAIAQVLAGVVMVHAPPGARRPGPWGGYGPGRRACQEYGRAALVRQQCRTQNQSGSLAFLTIADTLSGWCGR